MLEIEELIKDKKNKTLIADLVYQRLYNRFIKIFDFKNNETKYYEGKEQNIFKTEYKNGFIIMASSCILIETISSFLEGTNMTVYGKGKDSYNIFFEKCNEYDNKLKTFKDKQIYKNIRNAVLHQGETYDKFKIVRSGELYQETENKINATMFINNLKLFLEKYKQQLQNDNCEWDSKIWDNCRSKIRYIIDNVR